MTDRQPNEPLPADFKQSAEHSRDAGIADESAGYVNAIEKEGAGTRVRGESAEAPAEGSDETAPRQPGSPG